MQHDETIRELIDRVRGRWRALCAMRAFVRGALIAAVALGLAVIASRWTIGAPVVLMLVAAGTRRIAVNVDPREADPARITVEDFQSAVTRLKAAGGVEARVEARQQEDRQHLWQYALALMVLLLAGEGLLAARTA